MHMTTDATIVPTRPVPPVPSVPARPAPAPVPRERAARRTRRLAACDARAAAVSALVMLPQAIAFAVLAGLPPEMGIYSSIIPVIVAALLGPAAVLLSGPNTAVAVMIGVALLPLGAPGSQSYLALAATMTLMVGLVQLAMAIGGVGLLLSRLPRLTAPGLNMGIGVTMILMQVGPALGMLATRETAPALVPWVTLNRLHDINPWAVAVTLAALAAGRVFERRKHAWMPSLVATMLVGAVAGLLLDALVGPDPTRLERIGHIDLHIGVPSLPMIPVEELYVLKQLALSAIGIAMVGALQSVVILQSLVPDAGSRACRRELLAQAGSNLAASVCGGFAGSGSFNRTAAHVDSGARSRAAAVLSSVFLLGVAAAASPVFANLPRAAVAATLILVGVGMIRSGWRQSTRLAPRSRRGAVLLALVVAGAGIESALLCAAAAMLAGPLLRPDGGPCACKNQKVDR